MRFKARRLGPGDWLLLIGSVGLLIDLFGVSWFSRDDGLGGRTAGQASQTGWQALAVLGPLIVLVCLVGALIWLLQATRSSPALPTVMTTLLLPVAVLLFLALIFRVLADQPDGGRTSAGGYVAPALSLALAVGSYVSLRREGVAAADSVEPVETISVRAAREGADT